MDLIQSFSIDHTAIIPGIFVSREDKVGKDIVALIIILAACGGIGFGIYKARKSTN